MTHPRPLFPLLLAVAGMAVSLTACQRDSARMPTAVEATAPVASVGTHSTPVSHVAAALNPLGARGEIDRVMDHFLTVKSYHATMNASTAKGAMTIDMDFVAPDRYRMATPMGTQYVIGDTMYMTAHGHTMKVPLPKGQITHYRDPASFEANKATMAVESLGSDTVDGQTAAKYLMRNTGPTPGESTLWVSGDGYPLKIEVASNTHGESARTTIRYSRFNDPAIRIDPP